MFREMRRKKQQLDDETSLQVLQEATSGVLSVLDEAGYPYGVPLSHSYEDGKLYFHCAVEGHKLDAIRHCDKASFTVIAKDQVVTEEMTSYFVSVICFGRIHILEGDDKRRSAHMIMGKKFGVGIEAAWIAEMEKKMDHMEMLEFTIEHMTGKQAVELMHAGAMGAHAQRTQHD